MLSGDARLNELDRMRGSEFETFLVGLFVGRGHRVTWTGGFADKGVDLIVEIDSVRTAVQAKRWSRPVDRDCINTLFAGMARQACARGIAVTTNYFTRQATDAAGELGLTLWDRHVVALWLGIPPVEDAACAACGKAVSDRVVKFCRDQPARFDGRVYCPYHQKKQNRAA